MRSTNTMADDLRVALDELLRKAQTAGDAESSAAIRYHVQRAQEVQAAHFAGGQTICNADMRPKESNCTARSTPRSDLSQGHRLAV
jgi:hypothetical protein